MSRVETLRAARNSPQVSFLEYLKVRSSAKDGPVLIFEGKQCPAFYINKVNSIVKSARVYQLIARGKRNVLSLRSLILRNETTSGDFVLYFVDKDFDSPPAADVAADVYVTNGYSLENAFLSWSVIEGFVRSYFDIADADDQASIDYMKSVYNTCVADYLDKTKVLQRTIYACRKNTIHCLPGDEIARFLELDFLATKVALIYKDVETSLELCQVAKADWDTVIKYISENDDFERLDPVADWRGKFHFSFIRRFLVQFASARIYGSNPFKRPSKPTADPSHPSLLALLSGFVECPSCLNEFVSNAFSRRFGGAVGVS